jgi:gas vesicle protein
VSSISKLLGENFESSNDPKHQELLSKIHDVQKQITEKFDTKLHPLTISQLTDSIQTYTDSLQSLAKETGEKSKETIEAEANQYKELRELMSTKEFVIQYENGLKND